MNILVSKYDKEFHIASFAKRQDTFQRMQQEERSIAYLEEDHLFFYPEQWCIDLEEDEKQVLETIYEYSVLKFWAGRVDVCYDAGSGDNVLFITNKCNSSCVMCPTSDYQRKNSMIEEVDTLLEISKHIPSDAPHITITGGEPFLLRDDMFVLLDYLKMKLRCTEFLLLTNGRAFANERYFQLFMQTKPADITVAIPIHGSEEKLHDSITQAPGSFRQTIKGLEKLIHNGCTVEIRIVVSKLNYTDLLDIARLICERFSAAKVVNFVGLEMLGSARHNLEKVWLDYKTSFRLMERAVYYLVTHGVDVGIYNYPLCCVDKSYWSICHKSITGYKVRYLPECELCTVKDACGGLFQGSFRLMEGIVEAVKC